MPPRPSRPMIRKRAARTAPGSNPRPWPTGVAVPARPAPAAGEGGAVGICESELVGVPHDWAESGRLCQLGCTVRTTQHFRWIKPQLKYVDWSLIPTQIFVRSTEDLRTRMSCEAVAEALLPHVFLKQRPAKRLPKTELQAGNSALLASAPYAGRNHKVPVLDEFTV